MEYAIEAINNAGTCVGLQSSEGIVLAAEKRTVSKLLAPSKTSEKTYTVDDHISCLVAGLTADANILIHQARLASQRYLHLLCYDRLMFVIYKDISTIIVKSCQWSRSSNRCAITSKLTRSSAVCVLSALPLSLPDGTPTMAFNSIRVILLGIIAAGRPLLLVRIGYEMGVSV